MISKKYLLFLAGIVWSIAGYNVLHIGLQAYIAYLSTCPVFGLCSGIFILPVYDFWQTGKKTYKAN